MMSPIAESLFLASFSGTPIDARIEVEDGIIVLHSRGGATKGRAKRNTQYSEAFNLIIERLQSSSITAIRILIDSTYALKFSEDKRIVATDLDFRSLSLSDLKTQIANRVRNFGRQDIFIKKGGTSAKRLRFELPATKSQIENLLRLTDRFPTGSSNNLGVHSSGNSSSRSGNPPDNKMRWIEGDLKIARHLRRERSSGLAIKKKEAFILKHGKLSCERCGLDPVLAYKTTAAAVCIEVHHAKTRVSEMGPGHTTTLNDLQCLCANCHRLIHYQMAHLT